MSESNREWCIGCQQDHDKEAMVDLDGYGDWLVCHTCWGTMTPFERILLTILCKPATLEGGLNFSGELEILLKYARRAFRAWHGHEPDSACDSCDPLAAESYRKSRAARTARRQSAEDPPGLLSTLRSQAASSTP